MSAPFLRKIDNIGNMVDSMMQIIKSMSQAMAELEARIKVLEARKPAGRPPNGRKETAGGD